MRGCLKLVIVLALAMGAGQLAAVLFERYRSLTVVLALVAIMCVLIVVFAAFALPTTPRKR